MAPMVASACATRSADLSGVAIVLTLAAALLHATWNAVVKRSGVTEPFSREKVVRGVRRACQGRQVDDDALNVLAQQVEDTVRATGSPEVPSHEVGLAILGPLRELDEVAYLRFASVYRSFSSAEDFEREIEALRAHREVPAQG